MIPDTIRELLNLLFENGFTTAYYKNDSELPGLFVSRDGDVTSELGTKIPTKKKRKGNITPFIETITDDDFVNIYAELPGVSKDKIELISVQNKLTLKAVRDEDSTFVATVVLKNNVDLTNVKARYLNGILELNIPIKQDDKISIPIE